MANISRMQFLRGDIKGTNKSFRPPWALPEKYFIDFCTRCDQCIDACFDELIVKGAGGYPQMDFKRGGCDFCEDCLNVCESKALIKTPINSHQTVDNNNSKIREALPESDTKKDSGSYLPPWHIKANIDLTNCLSMNATICRSCGESCDDEAIKFNLKLGGIAEPVLDIDLCTGCGACFAACPVRVIELKLIELTKATIGQAEDLTSNN